MHCSEVFSKQRIIKGITITEDPGIRSGVVTKETKREITLKYSLVCLLLRAGCDCEACPQYLLWFFRNDLFLFSCLNYHLLFDVIRT